MEKAKSISREPRNGIILLEVLLCVLSCSLTISGAMYVRSGSDIRECNMRCPKSQGVLELNRTCGGPEETLLELQCDNQYTRISNSKFSLDGGCWTLRNARKGDSCGYHVWYYSNPQHLLGFTDIRVMDPVHISRITSNGSWPDDNIAVTVSYTGDQTSVAWDLDGQPLPERYQLMDDNRTVFIASARQKEDKGIFRVRISNLVSQEAQGHRLKVKDPESNRLKVILILGGVAAALSLIASVIGYYMKEQKKKAERGTPAENGPINTAEEELVLPTPAQNAPLKVHA